MAQDNRRSEETGPSSPMNPVLLRLAAAGARSPEVARRVLALGGSIDEAAAGAMLQQQGEPVRPRLLLSGLAYHRHHLPDGRRQVFDILLPGDPIWAGPYMDGAAEIATVAYTPVKTVDVDELFGAEARHACSELNTALIALTRASQRRRLDHIIRLGCLTALERLIHLLLELHDRLAIVNQVRDGLFALPLTQDLLASVLGLSLVHVNRTLHNLRRQGLAEIHRGKVRLSDRVGLAQLASYEAQPTLDRGAA